ncbi:hypothetical protein FY148_10665 [Agrobacterium tumefaciens]|uniref:hypothetical protein n=1 Tax=Agrobacterium tumefaciens TaxID=358 RepID=UPI0021D15E45|nr:hypothetical protein [Agrobacterium tumefaciens]UXS53080.1 hypothetical protein FY148_10665 [Agrobacterium tumefaciens]UXS63324.1 hypothetical protein FY147_10665 [Agrobacterium tumefaciens]
MGDPIVKAIQAAKISLLLFHPEYGKALADLPLRAVLKAKDAIELVDGELHFEREYVKALTQTELMAVLLCIARK